MLLDFFDPLKRLKRRCNRTLNDPALPESLKKLYAVNIPDGDTPLYDLPVYALDFETSGLDHKKDQILSVGGIALDRHGIDFSTAFHHLLKRRDGVRGETAVINMITPELLEKGEDPHRVMQELIQKLAGKIVICHCAIIEYSFLKRSLCLKDHDELPMIFLDTMAIERSLIKERGDPSRYSLNLIRKRRALPTYNAHNALIDSIAAAELFMAQVKDIFGKKPPLLGELYRRSH